MKRTIPGRQPIPDMESSGGMISLTLNCGETGPLQDKQADALSFIL
jgi:hypothetical protein